MYSNLYKRKSFNDLDIFQYPKELVYHNKKHNKVALVGIGPHAKRIYLNYLKKHKINLALVVELESKKEEIENYLKEKGFKNSQIFTIPDKIKYQEHLPKDVSSQLLITCNNLGITHLIISTEPKAHFMYLEFALKNNINVLTDKPITVSENMTTLKSIKKVRKQYYKLLDLERKSTATCKVMCQRKYHKGYEKIKKILNDVVKTYQIPITYIDIFHSDGNWEMPHDLNKENHPYKYGYGKLFHSGYHFIDLLSDLLKINNNLTDKSKHITSGEVFSKVFTPEDELQCINISDYKRLFANQNIPNYYYENQFPRFKKYGEKNFYGLLSFYNQKGSTITTANLNLLHDGVSRRSWIESRDFYKQNGRIRHERINIEVGHLLNIQVHSYQSKEINERTNDEENVGGLEHFDIYIFRNPLLGDKVFEEIHLGDLYSEKEKKEFMGYNELSREKFLKDFLNNKNCRGDLKDQVLAIEILYSCSKEVYNHYNKKHKVEKIYINEKNMLLLDVEKLRSYSDFVNINLDKSLIHHFTSYDNTYELNVCMNYIKENGNYEVYFCIDDGIKGVGGLLTKELQNKFIALLYYKYLCFLVKHIGIFRLIYMVRSKSKKINS